MTNAPSESQAAVLERVLAEEATKRRPLVVALSGAHAYGFPSPDSDLDLKGVHFAPAERFWGLAPIEATADRQEVIDGVEIDYTSNEIGHVLAGVLRGNGNFLERILGPIRYQRGPELASLEPLVAGAISKRVYRHYQGFATSQLREMEKSATPPIKKVLYVLRTTLTGAHALLSGAMVPDLTLLMDEYGFGEARQLVEAKRAGERAPLSASDAQLWRQRVARAFALLDDAYQRSTLPEEPPNAGALEAWLVETRRSQLGGS
jgi:hypothetical protein